MKVQIIIAATLLLLIIVFGTSRFPVTAHAQTFLDLSDVPIDRLVLPLQALYQEPITTLDARDVKPPPLSQVKAQKDAPNVLTEMARPLPNSRKKIWSFCEVSGTTHLVHKRIDTFSMARPPNDLEQT